MNRYTLVGAVVVVFFLGVVFWGAGDTPKDKRFQSALTPARSFSHGHGMSVDVRDASKVYIATHEGLYVLQNDKDLFHIGKTKDDLMGFSAHPTAPDIFFSSGHPARGGNVGFQKTVDGGVSWKQMSLGLDGPVDFHSMTVSAADPNTVYGFYGGKLQRSVDGGESWGYTQGTIRPMSLFAPLNEANVVYAATQDGVRVSKDRGDTWESLSKELEGGVVSVFLLHPEDPKLALVFSERLGGLGKSMDGGVTWKKVTENFGNGTVLYLAFSKTNPDVVYALTHSNSVYKSMSRGDSWQKVR